ncbi:hypothetical protein GDO86_007312 [Hymenochirus boettgeri]|uniref:Uncharacterized protein n=1 Tax=Hymenochirus boettgeri TaxID=247094 RepID=A0A8T2IYM7_9PIPI|nr:hypothetical protein GDO86_007312 [Hymenochirus boettgeri]
MMSQKSLWLLMQLDSFPIDTKLGRFVLDALLKPKDIGNEGIIALRSRCRDIILVIFFKFNLKGISRPRVEHLTAIYVFKEQLTTGTHPSSVWLGGVVTW